MNKKRIIVFLIGLIVVLSTISSITYAYFKANKSSSLPTNEVNYSIEDVSKTTIASFDDLVSQSKTTDSNANSTNEKASAVTLYLTSNVKFESDLVITRDCNLNLGTYQIDLNGYSLTLKNSHHSPICLVNGSIVNSKTSTISKIYVDLPNGAIYTNSLTTSIDFVTVASDEGLVSQCALNYALSKLEHYDYNYENTLYEAKDVSTVGCIFCNSSSATSCIYACDDLNFLDHYQGYSDLKYTYTVLDPTIVTNQGEFLKSGNTTVTIEATYGATTTSKVLNLHAVATNQDKTKAAVSALLNYFEKYVEIKSINDQDTRVYTLNGATMVPTSDSYFGVGFTYLLYLSSDDGTYTEVSDYTPYITMDHGQTILKLTSNIKKIAFRASISSTTTTTQQYFIDGTSSSAIMDNTTIAANIVSGLYEDVIKIYSDSSDINGYTSINLITDPSNYSSQFVSGFSYRLINNDENVFNISTSDVDKKLFVNGLGVRNSNPEDLLQNAYLEVTVTFSNESPYEPKVVVASPIVIEYHDQATDKPSGHSSFRPYYNVFNNRVNTSSKGYTYDNFTFRATYGKDWPIFELIPHIYDANKNEIVGIVKYEGVTYSILSLNDGSGNMVNTVTINGTTTTGASIASTYTNTYYYSDHPVVSYSLKIGTTVYASSAITKSLLSGTDPLEAVITIDSTYIPEEDSKVYLVYRYQMVENGGWTTDNDSFISTFTLPGIVRCGTNERFVDEDLYTYVFSQFVAEYYNYIKIGEDKFKCITAEDTISVVINNNTYYASEGSITINDLEDDTYNGTYEVKGERGPAYVSGSTFIITSKLSKHLDTIDFKDNTSIEGYNGLELLKDVNSLILQNSNVTVNDMKYIAGMEGLTSLDLSNARTKLTDYTTTTLGFPSGTRNDFIKELQPLRNLQVLRLNDNKIYNFTSLSGFASLTDVYVYNNTFTVSTAIIGTLLTNIVNGIYGTNGMINDGTFAALDGKGVNVWVGSGSSDSDKYKPKNDADTIIVNMMNIEYVRRLPNGVDISQAYYGLSTNPLYYNSGQKKSNSATDSGWGGSGQTINGNDSFSFGTYESNPNTATTFYARFTYEYCYASSGLQKQEVYYEIQYEIERY